MAESRVVRVYGAGTSPPEGTMRDREPTIRSRELGEGLRRAVDKAGLNGVQAAHELGWSTSMVSRLLSGKRGGNEVDVSALLAVCKVKGKERSRLLALCQEQHTPGWFQQHGSRLPKQVLTLIDHEDKAIAISGFQATLVPGLLQTGDYARATIIRSANMPAEEIEERVAARLARQSLFSRERPAQFTFYLHEAVLRLPIGGTTVMSDQLHHLLRMSVRAYVTLRVLPASLGAHAGLSGPFTLMEFARLQTGGVPGQRDLQPVPGEAGGDRRLPAHPGGAGRDRTGRGTIEGADCHRGNRALPGPRGRS
ncbi:MAG: helix-turn-helix transcriptional regulator [Geodermatophilaceae bacterium]